MTAAQLIDQLSLGADQVLTGDDISEDYTHDECVNVDGVAPAVVLKPTSTAEVSQILALANELRVPVTARGAGTGLSGGAVPEPDGILLSLERMATVIEVDPANHVAVVQPGVTLGELDEALAPHGLVYPILPGEESASLGGNVATNAGGMRAVKYGVTRHQVLGIEAVLPTGEVIRSGGKYVKFTTGYDIGQLIIGSEGTLAVVTEATLKVVPRLDHKATVLAPFETLAEVTEAVPGILQAGLVPLMLEYVDAMAMQATSESIGLDLGMPDDIKEKALAYLLVVLESAEDDRLQADIERAGELVSEAGAMDVYVLPAAAGAQVLEAREKAFWVAKEHGANDIIDVVVPRASIPEYLDTVGALAVEHEAWVAGAGHAGDGNVHLSVFQGDDEKRSSLMTAILAAGMALGGTISAEHGIGIAKRDYVQKLEDPAKLALMQRIKDAFDPNGILNPGKVF
ncbi:MAG: oxidoreductase [Acidimicrobiales bacterium]|nr:MAG: oxidoreductase [Acidimicrobiales bacterium]